MYVVGMGSCCTNMPAMPSVILNEQGMSGKKARATELLLGADHWLKQYTAIIVMLQIVQCMLPASDYIRCPIWL